MNRAHDFSQTHNKNLRSKILRHQKCIFVGSSSAVNREKDSSAVYKMFKTSEPCTKRLRALNFVHGEPQGNPCTIIEGEKFGFCRYFLHFTAGQKILYSASGTLSGKRHMTDQQIYSLSSRNSKGWVEYKAKKEYRDVRGEINGDVVQWRFGSQRCSVQDVYHGRIKGQYRSY